MKAWKICLALLTAPVFAQSPAAPAENPSPESEAALRARIDQFYQAQVTGKFRLAIPVIAEESQDWFISVGQSTYKSCATTKIEYSENFTKALVTETCLGEFRVHGHRMPVTLPIPSNWKVIDGQWYWYHIRETEVRTPFGIARIPPQDDPDAPDTTQPPPPMIPGSPFAMAQNILQLVKVDKTDIRLESGKANEDAVEVTNGMSGPISISVDNTGQQGLTVKLEKTELKAGEKARVVFRYNPEDPSIGCSDCAARVSGEITATLHVQPTAQTYQIRILISRTEPPKK